MFYGSKSLKDQEDKEMWHIHNEQLQKCMGEHSSAPFHIFYLIQLQSFMVTKYERALAGKKHQIKKWLLSSSSNSESSMCFIQTPIIQIPAICQIMS